MTYIKYHSPLPNYFILPFEEYYGDIALELEFFEDAGIHCGLFFDEVINIVYANVGVHPITEDFDSIDYIWISTAYDTWYRNMRATLSDDDLELEMFQSIYAGTVEKIFLCIYSDIEAILDKHGITSAFTLEFERFVHKDILLKATKYN
jgi:hypothetical protein